MAEPAKKKFKFSFEVNPDLCMACAQCETECAFDSVFIDDNVQYAINKDTCTRCGKCFRGCPADAIVKIPIS